MVFMLFHPKPHPKWAPSEHQRLIDGFFINLAPLAHCSIHNCLLTCFPYISPSPNIEQKHPQSKVNYVSISGQKHCIVSGWVCVKSWQEEAAVLEPGVAGWASAQGMGEGEAAVDLRGSNIWLGIWGSGVRMQGKPLHLWASSQLWTSVFLSKRPRKDCI